LPGTRVVHVSANHIQVFAATPGTYAIVFGYEAVSRLGVEFFRLLKSRYRSVALAGYLAPGVGLRIGFELAQAGVDALCIAGVDDHAVRLRQTIQAAAVHALAGDIASRLRMLSADSLAAKLEPILFRLPDFETPRDLAGALGLSLPRLRNWLRDSALPTPKRLLAWCRILVAAKMLEDGGRTAEGVGLWLNYSSGPAFRNACRWLIRCAPADIRRSGGLDFAIRQFGHELTEIRRSAGCQAVMVRNAPRRSVLIQAGAV
jgi:AraC-like DNA-binding protein